MLARSHNLLTIALVLTGTFLLTSDTGFGQTFVIEPAPTGYVTAYRGSYYAYPPVVAVPTTYTAYYAPQVPVVPMTVAPVPVVSAYYVPTTTVYYSAPVFPVRRFRRFAVPVAPVYYRPVVAFGY